MRARICPGTLMWRRQEGLNRSKKELMLISLSGWSTPWTKKRSVLLCPVNRSLKFGWRNGWAFSRRIDKTGHPPMEKRRGMKEGHNTCVTLLINYCDLGKREYKFPSSFYELSFPLQKITSKTPG